MLTEVADLFIYSGSHSCLCHHKHNQNLLMFLLEWVILWQSLPYFLYSAGSILVSVSTLTFFFNFYNFFCLVSSVSIQCITSSSKFFVVQYMKLGQYLVWEGRIWNYGTACLIITEHKNCKIESSCCVVFQEWSVPDFRERRVWTGWKIDREEYRSDNSSARFRRQGVRGVYSTVCAWLCYHRVWGISLFYILAVLLAIWIPCPDYHNL